MSNAQVKAGWKKVVDQLIASGVAEKDIPTGRITVSSSGDDDYTFTSTYTG